MKVLDNEFEGNQVMDQIFSQNTNVSISIGKRAGRRKFYFRREAKNQPTKVGFPASNLNWGLVLTLL